MIGFLISKVFVYCSEWNNTLVWHFDKVLDVDIFLSLRLIAIIARYEIRYHNFHCACDGKQSTEATKDYMKTVVIIVFRGRLTFGEVRKPKQRWMNEGAWTPNPEMPHPRAHTCFHVDNISFCLKVL